MKRTLLMLALVVVASSALYAQQPKQPEPIKMPAEYSTQLATLQEQFKKLEANYAEVISLYKDYVAKRESIQGQVAVLVTRAALAAKMTIEQLDSSMLTVDDKGNYQWTPKPKPETGKTGPPAPR